jgi:hypothetical protein
MQERGLLGELMDRGSGADRARSLAHASNWRNNELFDRLRRETDEISTKYNRSQKPVERWGSRASRM